MDKKSVFLVLVSGALGTAVGTQFPTAEVKAGQVEQKPFVHPTGTASEELKTQITASPNGVVYQAFQHANHADRMNGELTAGDCPVRHLHFRCQVIEGVDVYDWEYRTKKASRTYVWGEPQE